ncbi:LutB/LldF family L-lactate oxidation iron-sulfur protein [Arhodomonas sp. AD133]|uniref:LutB/LldF family L-lactate oxidation iron-sulfur protein n=1 Tax=Arhodomonas sp. AD133 TaxID=3415009 RepID=UPI003EC0B930
MEARTHTFKANARQALADDNLRRALAKAKGGFVGKRAQAVSGFPDFEALRTRGQEIKDHTLAHLDHYLARFTSAVEERGGQVHFAGDAASARETILGICRDAGARQVIKAKSMAGEEIELNEALERELEVVESDLGEYIIQLAKEPPSHIIAPAVHKTREDITRLFDEHHHGRIDGPLRPAPELVAEARRVLREKFLGADVGISGANFLVADTGSVTLVTNEGNADLGTALPRVHIVIAGIEKLVPGMDEASVMLRLLARSATGQEISAYTTFLTGPRSADEPDGPEEYHVVLLDNGRTSMLGNEFRPMLRCIRCGACMNHCPVYSAVGGHTYGWVYPGPMGQVLTPMFRGLDSTVDLPNACTLNGRCGSVCPVRIPLPDLIRRLRDWQFDAHLGSRTSRWALRAWGWVARHPGLYHPLSRLGARAIRLLGGRRGSARSLPMAGGWTGSRDLPLPTGTTFQAAWQRQRRHGHD